MRRSILVGTFITILLTVIIGGHFYLVQRLVVDPALPLALASALTTFILIAAASLVLAPIGERLLPRPAAQLIAWPAAVWMGLGFYLLILMVVSDLTWSLLGAAAESSATVIAAARGRAVGVTILALAIGSVGLRGALRGPVVKRLEIRLQRWPQQLNGFRIVQISDIHISTIVGRSFAQSLVERVNSLSPDLIAVTGDLVDGDVRRIGDEVEPFAGLRARHGTFFVTGNHDHYSGADDWVSRIEQLGFQPLRNRHVTVAQNGAAFDLAGVEDHHAHLVSGRHREDVVAAVRGRDADRAVILLAHDPATFPEAARLGVDLQLSGHTHGGQIWPFEYFVRLATPYVAGLYSAAGSQLYVSRGTGFWGPPMRFLAPAEITEIIVCSAQEPPGMIASNELGTTDYGPRTTEQVHHGEQ